MKKPDFLILTNDLAYGDVFRLTLLLEKIGKFGKTSAQIILDPGF